MKNKFNITIFLLIALTTFLNVSAQEKVIIAREFYDLRDKAYEKLKGKVYRETIMKETFLGKNSSPFETDKFISETVPPNKSRDYSEIKTAAGVVKTDSIFIGEKHYVKHGDEKWKEEYIGYGNGMGSGSSNDTRVYKFIERATLNNQPVDVYEVSGEHTAYYQEEFCEAVEKTRYWISKEGLLMKEDGEDYIAAKNVRIKETVIYEYDPKIKIETPIIKPPPRRRAKSPRVRVN